MNLNIRIEALKSALAKAEMPGKQIVEFDQDDTLRIGRRLPGGKTIVIHTSKEDDGFNDPEGTVRLCRDKDLLTEVSFTTYMELHDALVQLKEKTT